MMQAGKKEIRICSHIEGIFFKVIKLLVHERNYSMISGFGLAGSSLIVGACPVLILRESAIETSNGEKNDC